MSSIVLVDTSVLLNVLDVPGRNQNRVDVLAQLAQHIEQGDHMRLPMASILEAGNHIAHIGDGGMRRAAAETFVTQIRLALIGDAPWKPTSFPTSELVLEWLSAFPDHAMRGVGFGDLSIIKEWESISRQFHMSSVSIWSLDGDLQGYVHIPGHAH